MSTETMMSVADVGILVHSATQQFVMRKVKDAVSPCGQLCMLLTYLLAWVLQMPEQYSKASPHVPALLFLGPVADSVKVFDQRNSS